MTQCARAAGGAPAFTAERGTTAVARAHAYGTGYSGAGAAGDGTEGVERVLPAARGEIDGERDGHAGGAVRHAVGGAKSIERSCCDGAAQSPVVVVGELVDRQGGADARTGDNQVGRSRADIVKVMGGITRLAMEERNRRSRIYFDARTNFGIAECIAKFERDQTETTRRNLSILKARAAVAREQLFPERLGERIPQIAAVAMGYMKGERISNRERAAAMGVSESAYRQFWAVVVDWLLSRMIEMEQSAARRLAQALGGH